MKSQVSQAPRVMQSIVVTATYGLVFCASLGCNELLDNSRNWKDPSGDSEPTRDTGSPSGTSSGKTSQAFNSSKPAPAAISSGSTTSSGQSSLKSHPGNGATLGSESEADAALQGDADTATADASTPLDGSAGASVE